MIACETVIKSLSEIPYGFVSGGVHANDDDREENEEEEKALDEGVEEVDAAIFVTAVRDFKRCRLRVFQQLPT